MPVLTAQRNEYVLRKMFGSFFLATLMSSLMNQLGGFTDAIVVSHLVSPDTLSVVRLWGPFSLVFFIIVGLMSAGARFLSARAIGGRDYAKANCVFCSELYFVIVAALLTIALTLPFTGDICRLITDDPRLTPYLESYIHADYFTLFTVAVCGVPASYIINSGNPALITRRIIISQVLNALLDMLLCGVFELGLPGASLATAFSTLLAFTSLLGYMRRHSDIFRLRLPSAVCSRDLYRRLFIIGSPMIIAVLLTPVCNYVMNTLVVKRLGADAMYIYTVYFQIIGICMLAMAGINGAIISIGGILLGEYDYDSFRLLARRLLQLLFMIFIPVSLLVLLFPEALGRLFGASGELLAQCRTPFRLLGFYLLPAALASALVSLYFVQGHIRLCRFFEVLSNLVQLGFIVLMACFTPDLIWYAMPQIPWVTLLMILLMAWAVSRRDRLLRWPTLLSSVTPDVSATFSVPYTVAGVERMLADAAPLMRSCELRDGIMVDVALEELLYEVVEANGQRKKGECFDIRIVDTEERFYIVLKSKGAPHNPVYRYEDCEAESLDSGNIRQAVLSRVCRDITYKYMNGVNCIYLSYPKPRN